ncbi:MAG TPA: sensor histidine kinase [Pseudorhodoferax sp.]|nr:sensor histidine kinase [Pseudorhodoferax sp.]
MTRIDGPHPTSLRRRLLLWLSLPIAVFIAIDAYASYRAALATAELAFDRLLVTSAHALGDLIRLERGELQVSLPHAALELYDGAVALDEETATRSRMVYRVGFLNGDYLAGEPDVPPYAGIAPVHPRYGVRLALYDTQLHAQQLRMAALWQPVEAHEGLRYVLIQVGEPAAYRDALARSILWQTLQRQLVLLGLLLALVWVVATVALKPLRAFARGLNQRTASELRPLSSPHAPQELAPVVHAFNGLLQRVGEAQAQQQRLIADASHQLRTPLAILQLHAHAGLSGAMPAREALERMATTTERTGRMVHQLLAWSRARAPQADAAPEQVELRTLLEEVAVELSPLLARRHQNFQLEAPPCPWRGPVWMVQEIVVNLLHNALTYTPEGGTIALELAVAPDHLVLRVLDDGPGLPAPLQSAPFQPFVRSSGDGAGLGLAICHDLARACGGQLVVANRACANASGGVEARLTLPRWPAGGAGVPVASGPQSGP